MNACKYGDATCPCQDGDICHYEGDNPFPKPIKHMLGVSRRIARYPGAHHETTVDLSRALLNLWSMYCELRKEQTR